MMKRLVSVVLLLMLSNLWVIVAQLKLPPVHTVLLTVGLIVFFLIYSIRPMTKKARKLVHRLEVLRGGRELILCAGAVFLLDLCIYIWLIFFVKPDITALIVNGVIGLALIVVLLLNGILRAVFTSTQLSAVMRAALLFAWWVPVFHLFLFGRCCRVIRRECLFAEAKEELHEVRKGGELCKTKYPILLVHGIFWRDWQLFNYWGRIPKELIFNGATVYYGNQQSAAPIAASAQELKTQIRSILDREGCQKVNIIAHSKGGLDARYAIACLGMEDCVASLTTVGTPHRGCVTLDGLFRKLPDSLVRAVSKRYSAIFKKLGDKQPDFYGGIHDLTAEQCAAFNQEVPDSQGVFYQSVASKMSKHSSAGFPLNGGYLFVRRQGDNDGFVTVESAKWGSYLGCVETKKKRGVSHGDMIDLMRENIRGFDVCEYYVDIVKKLKEKGL